jgi:CheY-like chemotaxis protein
VDVRVVRTADAALAAIPDAAALIVDLNAAEPPPLELIRRAKSARPKMPIVAFLSHVQVELGGQAEAAGADQVLARSKFTERLPELLTSLAGRA